MSTDNNNLQNIPFDPEYLQKKIALTEGKLYYSISEAATLLNTSDSVLRFWETKFKNHLKPRKLANGTRLYTPQNIEIAEYIKYLTKTCGYTLEGANKKLTDDKYSLERRNQILKTLQNLRSFLQQLDKALS